MADTAEAAVALAACRPPEAVIVERTLPGSTAIDVLRGLRSWSAAPVIVMSGTRGGRGDRRRARRRRYQTKPFDVEELVARPRALLRRTSSTREPVIELGDLLTGRALLQQVWGPAYGRESCLIHTHMSLRSARSLKRNHSWLTTRRASS